MEALTSKFQQFPKSNRKMVITKAICLTIGSYCLYKLYKIYWCNPKNGKYTSNTSAISTLPSVQDVKANDNQNQDITAPVKLLNDASLNPDYNNCLLIIGGYMRHADKSWPWNMNISKDIYKLIWSFCQDIPRYFDKYNNSIFKVSKDNTIVKPISTDHNYIDCHMIYPSPNGFVSGTHKWSVKYIKHTGIREKMKSIGVTTTISDDWIQRGTGTMFWVPSFWSKQIYGSCWNGWSEWKDNEIIEVILNMDKFVVKYYKVNESLEVIKLQEEKLEPNHKYYFALNICPKKYASFECTRSNIKKCPI